MLEYVILGTSHEIQDSTQFEQPVMGALQRHAIALVAEEYPFDIESKVRSCARLLNISYLQIDLFPKEWAAYGIDHEMKMRADAACLQGQDCRLSHADAVREDFWLKRIEKTTEGGRVLVICGYLHSRFLAEKIRERGGRVVAESTFPADLSERKPTKIFSPEELKEYLQENDERAGY